MSGFLYLGVDGGGTSCRARLADQQGRALGEGRAGSANLTLGLATAAAAIIEAAEAACAAAGLPSSALDGIACGLGLAGANVPALKSAITAWPFPFARPIVASDAEIACRGAHGGGDGGIVILGTGSQGLALVGGQTIAVGGWGFLLSDQGSGAVLGRALMRAAVAAVDGLAPSSPLTTAALADFAGDPARVVPWALHASPKDYAALAPLIFAAADAGDPVGRQLVEQALAEVVQLVDRLHALGAPHIALMGGLAALYQPWLPDRLAPVIVPPLSDALDGALQLARRSRS